MGCGGWRWSLLHDLSSHYDRFTNFKYNSHLDIYQTHNYGSYIILVNVKITVKYINDLFKIINFVLRVLARI